MSGDERLIRSARPKFNRVPAPIINEGADKRRGDDIALQQVQRLAGISEEQMRCIIAGRCKSVDACFLGSEITRKLNRIVFAKLAAWSSGIYRRER